MSDRHRVLDAASTAAHLRDAARWIAQGGIVVYPTDTFYGLAVDPSSARAVDDLFDVKGRDAAMAIPLTAASFVQVQQVFGTLPDLSDRLARVFWPGPLSLILDAPAWVTAGVHAGRHTVAVRVPDHDVARLLADMVGRPITATSANPSGKPPVRSVVDLGTFVADPRLFVLDAGSTPGGAPSTLVDARGAEPQCVRAGAIAWDRVLTSR